MEGSFSQVGAFGLGMQSEHSYPSDSALAQGHLDGFRKSSNASSAAIRAEHSSTDTPGQNDATEDPIDNSPYSQVRASVSATDNTTLSISTPRMWILSLLFALSGSATNLFFSLRYPSVAITPVIALVLVHPLGKLWDLLLKRHDDPRKALSMVSAKTMFQSLTRSNRD
ncbi:hypothetical protein HC762_01805 [bacterium]|nr:hypothetical protein [bacterium]